ncbi:hypothetical protein [Allocoleopsis sp.]|uniref:hypothetical protein n=1 Tax=Allocoleopsis sp. TaxID=3088169 RepID=UPI002FD31C38
MRCIFYLARLIQLADTRSRGTISGFVSTQTTALVARLGVGKLQLNLFDNY